MTARVWLVGLALQLTAGPAIAQQVQIGSGSVAETVKSLEAGEYVWAPQIAPAGPTLFIVGIPGSDRRVYDTAEARRALQVLS